MTVYLKVTRDSSAYYRRYLKYMKKFFISKSMIISITFFQNIYVDLGKYATLFTIHARILKKGTG